MCVREYHIFTTVGVNTSKASSLLAWILDADYLLLFLNVCDQKSLLTRFSHPVQDKAEEFSW